ncbi:MAG TPA: hypothetical protein VH600_00810 [Burkholderiales bacterium]|jgi:hypothetical protein
MADSLELTFLRHAGPAKRLGPYRLLRFEGEVIRAEPGGPVLARHEHHEWNVNGERYPRLQCDSRASIRLERLDGSQSQSFGPYESVTFIDGVAYADHQIFAFVDRSIGDWYCHEDERHWTIMLINPVPEPPTRL